VVSRRAAAPSATDGAMSRADKITIGVMIFGAFLSVLNQTQMNPALPAIMEDLNVSANTVQWLVSGFTLINAITVAISAFLMDKFKSKLLFLGAFALFVIGSLLAAWGPTFIVLLIGRFLQAICAGIMIPLSMTTLLLLFPLARRGFAMGLFSFVIMFGPAIGPAISGILTDRVGWHFNFLVMAILAAILIVVAALFMEDSSQVKDVSLDKLSVLLCTVGLFSLLYGFSMIGYHVLIGVLTLVIGAVVLYLFAKRQFKMAQPFLQIRVLGDNHFRIGVIVLMLISASLTAAAITLPMYVQQVRGLSATISGMVMMPGAILGAVTGLFAGRLADRIGTRPLALIGITLVIIGSAGMILWGMATPVAMLIVIYCIRYIGLMLTNPPMNLWSISTLTDQSLNHGNAVSNTMRQVASTFGTALMVTLMTFVTATTLPFLPTYRDDTAAQLAGIHATFYLSTLIGIIALILIFKFVKHTPKHKVEDVNLDEMNIEGELTEI